MRLSQFQAPGGVSLDQSFRGLVTDVEVSLREPAKEAIEFVLREQKKADCDGEKLHSSINYRLMDVQHTGRAFGTNLTN